MRDSSCPPSRRACRRTPRRVVDPLPRVLWRRSPDPYPHRTPDPLLDGSCIHASLSSSSAANYCDDLNGALVASAIDDDDNRASGTALTSLGTLLMDVVDDNDPLVVEVRGIAECANSTDALTYLPTNEPIRTDCGGGHHRRVGPRPRAGARPRRCGGRCTWGSRPMGGEGGGSATPRDWRGSTTRGYYCRASGVIVAGGSAAEASVWTTTTMTSVTMVGLRSHLPLSSCAVKGSDGDRGRDGGMGVLPPHRDSGEVFFIFIKIKINSTLDNILLKLCHH